ncbi:MAG TPA: uroporphyrinogen-III synthase [Candidatus Binatia bacterium]|nr:uroporphyrinogen-III synthase [Candidatus Binatia bacterium]
MALGTADTGSASADALRGKRIVVTRARAQALSLVRRLESFGAEVVEFPTIEIRPPESYGPLDQAIRQIASFDWIIFTSVNGVEQFLNRFEELGKEPADLTGVKIGAIGPETAKSLTAAHIEPNLVPKQYQAEGILEALIPETLRGKRVLIPRAAKARDILPETLRQWGARVDVVEAYQTVLPQADVTGLCKLLCEGRIDVIAFTSSSTVTNFATLLRDQDLPKLLCGVAIASIGPVTRKTVEDLGVRSEIVSKEFTIPGLVSAIADYFGGTPGEVCGSETRSVKA